MPKFEYYGDIGTLCNRWYIHKYYHRDDLYVEVKFRYGPWGLFYYKRFVDSDYLHEVEVCHS